MLLNYPLDVWNTIGSTEAIAIGKVKFVSFLGIAQSIMNLIFDLLLVRVFGMGISGTAYSTLITTVIRTTILYIYLYKETDLLRIRPVRCGSQMKNIVENGLPTFGKVIASAMASWIIALCVINATGAEGTAIKEVCLFAFNVSSAIFLGCRSTLTQMIGMGSSFGVRYY